MEGVVLKLISSNFQDHPGICSITGDASALHSWSLAFEGATNRTTPGVDFHRRLRRIFSHIMQTRRNRGNLLQGGQDHRKLGTPRLWQALVNLRIKLERTLGVGNRRVALFNTLNT